MLDLLLIIAIVLLWLLSMAIGLLSYLLKRSDRIFESYWNIIEL